MSTPNELQRYMPYSSCAGQRGYMEKEDAGQWVKHSDIEPLIRSHWRLVRALEAAVNLLELTARPKIGDILSSDELIAALGLNPWCVNEGLATGDEEVSIDSLYAALAAAKEVAQPTRAARE